MIDNISQKNSLNCDLLGGPPFEESTTTPARFKYVFMRFAIFGDIHANLHALETVLEDSRAQSCTHYACLGDIVGYNAFPKQCLEIVRKLGCPTVQGNHDEQAARQEEAKRFQPLAKEAIDWTRRQLSEGDKQWLRSLHMIHQVQDFTIVHASLDSPHQWGYILSPLDAAESFSYQAAPICFVGHTHAPQAYVCEASVHKIPLNVLLLQPDKKYLINVGSVGQPRDGDWRAAYCIYDPDSHQVELRRIAYDVASAQRSILSAGLPAELAARLTIGR